MCDRLIVLDRGVVLFDGMPQALIQRAEGHAAIVEVDFAADSQIEDRFRLTSRVITPKGARCRIVGDDLPPESRAVTPTLEDAYIYCMMQGEAKG